MGPSSYNVRGKGEGKKIGLRAGFEAVRWVVGMGRGSEAARGGRLDREIEWG